MSKANGLAAIVEEERPTEAPPVDAPVQLVLADALGVPVDGAHGPIVAAPDDEGDAAELVLGERRVGRPPGRRNKATEAWRAFILGQHGSPLQALARIYAADPQELARRLGCKPIEALDKIITAARVAVPYLHSSQPVDVRLEGKGALAVGIFTGLAASGDHQLDMSDPLKALQHFASLPPEAFAESEQFQQVSEAADGQSNAAQSNASPQSEADQ